MANSPSDQNCEESPPSWNMMSHRTYC
jgi:hypothetical protein